MMNGASFSQEVLQYFSLKYRRKIDYFLNIFGNVGGNLDARP